MRRALVARRLRVDPPPLPEAGPPPPPPWSWWRPSLGWSNKPLLAQESSGAGPVPTAHFAQRRRTPRLIGVGSVRSCARLLAQGQQG